MRASPTFNPLTFKCKDCGKEVKRTASNQKRCSRCQAAEDYRWKIAWNKAHPEYVREKDLLHRRQKPLAAMVTYARVSLRKFLKLLRLPANYNPRKLVKDLKISNKRLEKLTKGNGRPDWKNECLEEKAKTDWLQVTQWARAILEYRAGRKYKVAWRFTSTKRRVFQTVFDFYEWQQNRRD